MDNIFKKVKKIRHVQNERGRPGKDRAGKAPTLDKRECPPFSFSFSPVLLSMTGSFRKAAVT
jgi:hypothetical protein